MADWPTHKRRAMARKQLATRDAHARRRERRNAPKEPPQ